MIYPQWRTTHVSNKFLWSQRCSSYCVRLYTIKGSQICSFGSKFFPFRVDLFSEGAWCAGYQTGSHSFSCKTWRKIYQGYSVQFKCEITVRHIYFMVIMHILLRWRIGCYFIYRKKRKKEKTSSPVSNGCSPDQRSLIWLAVSFDLI